MLGMINLIHTMLTKFTPEARTFPTSKRKVIIRHERHVHSYSTSLHALGKFNCSSEVLREDTGVNIKRQLMYSSNKYALRRQAVFGVISSGMTVRS